MTPPAGQINLPLAKKCPAMLPGFFIGCNRFPEPALSFRDVIQQVEELREADGGRFRSLDERFAFGPQRSYAEGHGDAMVAAGVDGRAVQRLSAGHVQAVLKLGYLRAHGAQVLRHQCDAVGLLDAQFLCVADADAAAGVRAQWPPAPATRRSVARPARR